MGGGEETKEFSWGYLNNLWNNGNVNDDVHYPKSSVSSFSNFFTQYCWIGPPNNSYKYNYGLGFFLYKFKNDSEVEQSFIEFNEKNNKFFNIFSKPSHEKFESSYAILRITRDNIGPLTPLPKFQLPKDQIPFKTPFDLIEDLKVIIPQGSFYGWNFDDNCFIFKVDTQYFYANIV